MDILVHQWKDSKQKRGNNASPLSPFSFVLVGIILLQNVALPLHLVFEF